MNNQEMKQSGLASGTEPMCSVTFMASMCLWRQIKFFGTAAVLGNECLKIGKFCSLFFVKSEFQSPKSFIKDLITLTPPFLQIWNFRPRNCVTDP